MNQGSDSDGTGGDGAGGGAAAGEARAAWLAALAWQLELGADEAIAEAPQDRFAESAAAAAARAAAAAQDASPARDRAPQDGRGPAGARSSAPAPAQGGAQRGVQGGVQGRAQGGGGAPAARPGEATAEQAARAAAAACGDLAALHQAIRDFEGCALKKGARRTVIHDGVQGARVMIVGEAPGRDEDRLGRPFVGRSGQLLDRMLEAIGLSRAAEAPEAGVYISNIVYWRPIENRRPSGDEVSMLTPFLERHIELAAPEFLVLMGAAPAQALLQSSAGITRLRGRWRRWRGLPVLPSFHPAYLLRQPEKKRESWRDLLALRAALDGAPIETEDA